MSTNIQSVNLSYRIPETKHAKILQEFALFSIENNFSYFPKIARDHYLKAWHHTHVELRLQRQNDLLICAWQDENIVGLVSGTPPEGGVGTIIWLMVHPDFQSQGIGAMLLNQAKNYYKTHRAHKIKLTVSDKRAVNFYLRENFIEEAIHPNHWWNLTFSEMVFFID